MLCCPHAACCVVLCCAVLCCAQAGWMSPSMHAQAPTSSIVPSALMSATMIGECHWLLSPADHSNAQTGHHGGVLLEAAVCISCHWQAPDSVDSTHPTILAREIRGHKGCNQDSAFVCAVKYSYACIAQLVRKICQATVLITEIEACAPRLKAPTAEHTQLSCACRPYQAPGAGLGGSAAHALLNGRDPVQCRCACRPYQAPGAGLGGSAARALLNNLHCLSHPNPLLCYLLLRLQAVPGSRCWARWLCRTCPAERQGPSAV
jgi:hypothetical protein